MDTYRIEWHDSLSIGDEHVDSQHKMLIKMISDIPEYKTSGDEQVLMAALEYAGVHFADEEKFMEEVGYPNLHEHQNEHKRLTKILLSYKKDYDEGKTDLYNFKQFMFRWVRDHIMDVDHQIGVYLQSSNTK
jgi:hemerythrin